MKNFSEVMQNNVEIVGYILKTYEKIDTDILDKFEKYLTMSKVGRQSDTADFSLTFYVGNLPKMIVEFLVEGIEVNHYPMSRTFIGIIKRMYTEKEDIKVGSNSGFQLEYYYDPAKPSFLHLFNE